MMVSTPLDIVSILNFRDVGGHATRHGGHVRSSIIFRSGSPATVTRTDCDLLRNHGVRLVWDLRSNSERASQPFEPNARWAPEYKFNDYDLSGGNIGAVVRQAAPSSSASRELMIQSYRKFPVEQAAAFRSLFRDIADGAFPMIINCMAGKDRTGVAAALLLDLLEVDRADIMRDYLVSVGVADRVWENLSTDHPGFLSAGRECWDPLVRCQPAYLEAYFETIDRDYGSAAGYIQNALGIDPADCGAIRSRLVETMA